MTLKTDRSFLPCNDATEAKSVILTDVTLHFSANDYGLFLSDEDPKKGIWLEAGKALDYYMLRNGVSRSCNTKVAICGNYKDMLK